LDQLLLLVVLVVNLGQLARRRDGGLMLDAVEDAEGERRVAEDL